MALRTTLLLKRSRIIPIATWNGSLRRISQQPPSWHAVFCDSSHLYLSWVRNSLLMTVLGVSARGSACNKDHRWKKRLEENSVSIGFLGLAAGCLTMGSVQHFATALQIHRVCQQVVSRGKLMQIAAYTSGTVVVWMTTVHNLLKRDLRISLFSLDPAAVQQRHDYDS